MGKQEKIQKELDLLLEKIKFWRYVLLTIISGIIGVMFAASQNKVIINFTLSGFIIFGFIGIIISVKRIGSIDSNYRTLLNILGETK